MPNFKSEFIKQVLQSEGQRYLKNQGAAMLKRLHFHSHDIINRRSAKVSTPAEMDAMLTIKHTAYERFLDIKRKTRNRKTNKLSTRSLRIHNRFVFGHYYSIANRLMNDFTDEARDAIIKDFNAMNHG